jgi:hypothetical protein
MKISHLFLSLLLLLYVSEPLSLAQRKANKKTAPTPSNISQPTDVVFAARNDGLPDTLKLRGTITEVSFAQADCGVIFWSGTAKIELLEKINGYPHENVFLVVPCFVNLNNQQKYLNKVVRLEVSKLYPNYNHYSKKTPCYFEIITNTINSRGVPFYCSLFGQEEILKSIEQEPAPKE